MRALNELPKYTPRQRLAATYLIRYRRAISIALAVILGYQVIGLVVADRDGQGTYVYPLVTIEAGHEILASDLATDNWYGIKRWPTLIADPNDAIGRTATTTIPANTPISETSLLTGSEGTSVIGLPALLICVPTSVAKLVTPGSHVDVYLPETLDRPGRLIASDVIVITEIAADSKITSSANMSLVIAADEVQAAQLAGIDSTQTLNVVLRTTQ